MGNLFFAFAAVVPWVFIIASNQDNVHLVAIITWGVALIGLFWNAEDYGWKLTIFWMVFGMPIAFYYTAFLFLVF